MSATDRYKGLTEKQCEYIDNANARWNIKHGAMRAGKSYVDFAYMIPKRIRERKGQKGLVFMIGNTQGTLERNVLRPMRDIYGKTLVGEIVSGRNTVRLFGEECYALGAPNIGMLNRFRGPGCKYFYGDEAATWVPEIFLMMQSRLDAPGACADLTCNAEHPTHWLKKFIDDPKNRVYSQHYTIDDNPKLTPEFVNTLKIEYEGTVYYKRYIEGLWVPAEGGVYKRFGADPNTYTIEAMPSHNSPDRIVYANIGVDFGGNKSKSAFVCTGFTTGFRKAITIATESRDSAVDDPEALGRAFADFCEKVLKICPVVRKVYADNAEPILMRGLKTWMIKRKIPLAIEGAWKTKTSDRIRFMNEMLGRGQFFIVKGCEDLIAAMQEAVWDPKAETDTRLDNGTYNVDVLDALEYTIEPVTDYLRLAVIRVEQGTQGSDQKVFTGNRLLSRQRQFL